MSIGKKIRDLRLQKRMKMTEVAKLIEVSVSTYRDWEYGRKIPAKYIGKIATALSASIGDLTGEKSTDNRTGIQKTISLLLGAVEILQKNRN